MNLSFYLDNLVINFSLLTVRLLSIIFFHPINIHKNSNNNTNNNTNRINLYYKNKMHKNYS